MDRRRESVIFKRQLSLIEQETVPLRHPVVKNKREQGDNRRDGVWIHDQLLQSIARLLAVDVATLIEMET